MQRAYPPTPPSLSPLPSPQHTYNDTDSQKSKSPPQFKSHLHSANKEKNLFPSSMNVPTVVEFPATYLAMLFQVNDECQKRRFSLQGRKRFLRQC